MGNNFSYREAILIATGDEFVTNLPQHTLFLSLANLNLPVTDKGTGALLCIQYSQDFQLGIALANGVWIYLQVYS